MRLQIDIRNVLEILSSRIYDSPYAMLRENVQNAYDAVLMRVHKYPGPYEPTIDVKITQSSVEIADNGIGMTPEDLKNHFWRAGASGKNTAEARAAGVVGTFGIGGLANFGICKKLTVITEPVGGGSRTKCVADRDTLSLEEDSISVDNLAPQGTPGTTVIAELPPDRKIDVVAASEYLKTFVQHIPVCLSINGQIASMRPLQESCPPETGGWSREIKQRVVDSSRCDLKFKISENGIVWIEMDEIVLKGTPIEGRVLLKQGMGQIMALRSGFGLARAGVSSNYFFGGIADLKILQPTAGRDALTTESIQILQSLVSVAEVMIASLVADSPYADNNTAFMSWAAQRGLFELVKNLKVTLLPSMRRVTLEEVKDLSQKIQISYYNGEDESIANAFMSEQTPMIRISRSNPRAKCEEQFLGKFTKAKLVSGEPKVLNVKPDGSWTKEEAALSFKLGQILESDYFVPVKIQLGKISHNLPMLVQDSTKPVTLTINPETAAIETLLHCYHTDYGAFGSFVKDFTRTVVFPRISYLVPSSTREGAEAFLKILRRQREVFELSIAEMRQMDDVIAGFMKGTVTFTEAVDSALASAQKREEEVTVRDVQPALLVLRDVVKNQKAMEQNPQNAQSTAFDAKPPIIRSDIETDAKMLVLDDSEQLYGYKGLLRLSEHAYADRADFFFQPHFTEVIWGGQKIILIFRHVSGAYGFYYDIQLNEVMNIPSGGRSYETMTVILKNCVFLPIPSTLFPYFTPTGNEKKRFEVRYDILYPE